MLQLEKSIREHVSSSVGFGVVELHHLAIWTLNDWLRNDALETAKDRIIGLINLLQSVQDESLRGEPAEERQEQVRNMLAPYTGRPRLVFVHGDSAPTFLVSPIEAEQRNSILKDLYPFNGDANGSNAKSPDAKETKVAWFVVQLAMSSQLFYLRRCGCGNYFELKRKSQKNCSTACSKRAYAQTEKHKAHRREYMRNYYKKNYSRFQPGRK